MKSKLKAWAGSAASGLAMLGLGQVLAPWLGFGQGWMNPVSLVTAGLLGLPGIVGLLMLRVIFLL